MATVKEIIITWVQFKKSWLSEAPWLCWTLKFLIKQNLKEKGNLLVQEALKAELRPPVEKSKQREEDTRVGRLEERFSEGGNKKVEFSLLFLVSAPSHFFSTEV